MNASSSLSLLAVVLTAVALPCKVLAQTGSANWNGSTGNWTSSTLWTTTPNVGFSPNDGNDGRNWNATINGFGTITLDTAITIEQLNFQSGTITGSNDLTMNGLMTWSGGTLSGTGGTFANGGVAFNSAGTMTLSGRALSISGSSTWSNGTISVGNGGVLTNVVGSTFTATSNNALYNSTGSGSGLFVNNGTFVKSVGIDTTSTRRHRHQWRCLHE